MNCQHNKRLLRVSYIRYYENTTYGVADCELGTTRIESVGSARTWTLGTDIKRSTGRRRQLTF